MADNTKPLNAAPPVRADTPEPIGVNGMIGWAVAFVIQCAIDAGLAIVINGFDLGLWAPLFSHGLQWVVFIPSFIFRTEKFYDLTGSITYISMSFFTLAYIAADGAQAATMTNSTAISPTFPIHLRQLVSSCLVCVWAFRLGSFLFARIRKDQEDVRFRELKKNCVAFLGTWNTQGMWVYLTALPVWACNSRIGALQPAFGWLDCVGIVLWVYGFSIEVVADSQKAAWRKDPANKGRYIDVGLWRYSRHPNYFGEWMLWTGQYVLCCSAFMSPHEPGLFAGSGFVSGLNVLFVFCLLNYVSGVPMLEDGSDKRWGHEDGYKEYKKETWVFFLLPTRRTDASIPTPMSRPDPVTSPTPDA